MLENEVVVSRIVFEILQWWPYKRLWKISHILVLWIFLSLDLNGKVYFNVSYQSERKRKYI
jgi:hypothetical protein